MDVPTISTPERIAAYPLSTQRGIRQISDEEVHRVAGVCAMEFDLESDAVTRSTSNRRQLLAIFDVLDEWFQRDDFEALCRVDVLLPMGSSHPFGPDDIGYISTMRRLAASLVEGAGLARPEEFALSWNMLVIGAIANAVDGDHRAAARAKELGRALITLHEETSRAYPVDIESVDTSTISDLDLWF
jgi:hypothetical protein